MSGRKLRLERNIATRERSVRSKRVAKGQVAAPRIATLDDYVKVMCAASVGPSHEPLAIDQGSVERIRRRVAQRADDLPDGFCPSHGFDAREEIDDRFCAHARNRGASDVLDFQEHTRRQGIETRSLACECRAPGWLVGMQGHLLVDGGTKGFFLSHVSLGKVIVDRFRGPAIGASRPRRCAIIAPFRTSQGAVRFCGRPYRHGSYTIPTHALTRNGRATDPH